MPPIRTPLRHAPRTVRASSPGRPAHTSTVLLAAATLGVAALVGSGTAAPAAAQQIQDPPVPPSVGTAAWEPAPARSQPFELTIRNIMRGPELLGQSPSGVRFTDDGDWIYFSWLPGGHAWDADRETWRVPATGGEPERVEGFLSDSLEVRLSTGDFARDGALEVVSEGGDLWLVDHADGTLRRLTETREGEGSPLFDEEGTGVLYRQGDNLFRMDLSDGSIRQVTDLRTGTPPEEDEEAEGQRGFLERQQVELFETIRREQAREARRDSLREAASEGEPEPTWIPRGERLGGLEPARDGEHVLVTTYRSAEGALATPVPFWITESGYTEPRDVRTKVGDAQGSSRVGLLETATGELTWLELAPEDFEGDVSGSPAAWNREGTKALLASRSEDNENRWIWSLDAATGELTLLEHLYDEAWVGGPCSWGCLGWIPGTDRAWYVSEESGWAHVYTIDADGTDRRALTSGEWEVLDVELPQGAERFLVTTNEGSPFNQHVGWLDFDGGAIEYMTSGTGSWDATLSPDLERAAWIHSVSNRPPELYVSPVSDQASAVAEQVTVSPTEDWLTFPWVRPEIVRFTADDGASVPARIYRPSDMGAEPNGAAVVFVHGAGYLHNVHDYWSSYEREYMFHHLLAASGYTVLDIDYRGSAGYGRDWRTGIYRWMGGKDLSDQVDGAEWLVAEEGIDPERIGIYGGSYGGFITLMALFTAGDTFKSGAALRSVTDWAHYNHGYTSNILNLPQDDPEAYRKSSPIYFAEGFGPDQHLLIAHGMVDTNVHFSDVVRLAQRLIELGKENWEMAVYPVENHGFAEPSSWTDEYRRIFELFERTMQRPGCTEDGQLCAAPEVVVEPDGADGAESGGG